MTAPRLAHTPIRVEAAIQRVGNALPYRTMTTPDILCLGEAMVEFVRQGDGLTYAKGFGGDTSNAAIAAARQGASVGYVSAVGTDRFGDDLLALWQGIVLPC